MKDRDIYGIGHDEEIENLVSVLGKISNKNALLIGEPGVGKSSIMLGIAQRINRGDVPNQLKDRRILQFDINGLIAHSSKDRASNRKVHARVRKCWRCNSLYR